VEVVVVELLALEALVVVVPVQLQQEQAEQLTPVVEEVVLVVQVEREVQE
tara:strand:- start:177 stop:326 length:150 start_codon:yes stop_codon:yes gene_type:complete